MRWRPLLVALLLFLAVLPTAAWFSAPWWLPLLAKQQLAGYGLTLMSMQIERIGWHETSLKQLHIRQTDGALAAKVRNLTAGYSIGRLLDGQLDSLVIATLQLQLHTLPGQKKSPGPALFAPAALIVSIPITHMQISDLSLRQLDKEGRLLRLLVGQASLRDRSMSAKLRETASDNPLQARLTLDTAGRLQADLRQGTDPVVQLEGLISDSGERLAMESEMHVELAVLDRVARQWLEMPAFRLQGSLAAKWRASLPARANLGPDEIRTSLTASASFALQAMAVRADATDNISARLDGEIGYAEGKGNWRLADSSQLLLGQGRKQQQLQPAALSGSFELAQKDWHIGLNQGGKVSAGKLPLGDISLAGASISLIKPVSLSPLAGGGLQLDAPAAMAVQLPAIRSGNSSATVKNIKLLLDSGPLAAAKGRFEVAGLKLTAGSARIPEASLSGSFDLSHKPLSAAGKLASTDGNIRLDWYLSQRPAKGTGKLAYSLQPLRFGPGGVDIAGFIDTRDAYELQAGRISGNGNLTWRPGKGGRLRLDHQLNLELASLAGFYKTDSFSALNGTLQIAINDNALSLASDNLAIGEFNAGIPIRKLSMHAAMTYPFAGAAKVSVGKLRGETLGGHVSSEHIDIDFARASNPFVVTLEQLDARQIAEIHKQEGLYADGILDGTLPLDWTKDGLRLVQGRLEAREPGGTIRYLGTESVRNLAASDRATKMALDILSDLHYRLLKIGIDAEPDGDMTLHIELKGRNPGYENGRPIEFNLNIEENVLKLLYSLRMADEISDRFEKQMQKKLQKK